MNRRRLVSMLVLLAAWGAAFAQDDAPGQTDQDQQQEGLTSAEQVKILESVKPSLAVVEVWLQYDKGEAPPYEDRVTEERPFETAALVLAPDKVLTQDMPVHPRFVKRTCVRFGDQTVDAKPWAYLLEQDAVILVLDKPLEDARPLEFKADAEGPYLSTPYYKRLGVWTVSIESLSADVGVDGRGAPYTMAKNYALVIDQEGQPVGVSYFKRLPIDGSWKGSPLEMPMLSAEAYETKLDALKARCEKTLCRVTLNFRSPKKRGGRMARFGGDDGESATERHVAGVVLDANTVIVLADLKPKVTARLERIAVHVPGGDPVAATFQHTLKDHGCFLAKLETAAGEVVQLSAADVLDFHKKLLLTADVRIQGEKRIVYYNHRRIHNFEESWKRKIYPRISGRGRGDFFFDTDGKLLIMPLGRREKGGERRYWRSSDSAAMPCAYVKEVLDDLAENIDASNVPVSEEEENRLAWMGVVLQPLSRELARINKVSDRTQDGETGAIVSYVYPDSPAATAGVEPGWIILRLHVEDEPKPYDVVVEESVWSQRPFPWEQLDRIPVQAFERAPVPWQAAENAFTRTLTDFGFGKKYTAEFFSDGQVVTKDLEIVQSPPHYDSAAKFKSETVGLTVRDMTFEVRRYFQKKPDDPCVMISKVEPGSKADVGGVKPYEIITHVNDKPVNNVKDFETLTADQQELRLSVLRMTRGRQVKLKLDAPEAGDEKDEQGQEKPADADQPTPDGGGEGSPKTE
jgi:hypothetical protein